MRTYNGENEKKLVGLVCNCCGKILAVKGGIPREGHAGIKICWDYFSEKDGETHQFDLCEECYDEIIEQFDIPVEVAEETTLI